VQSRRRDDACDAKGTNDAATATTSAIAWSRNALDMQPLPITSSIGGTTRFPSSGYLFPYVSGGTLPCVKLLAGKHLSRATIDLTVRSTDDSREHVKRMHGLSYLCSHIAPALPLIALFRSSVYKGDARFCSYPSRSTSNSSLPRAVAIKSPTYQQGGYHWPKYTAN
jgi:hypothetical protein